MKRVITGFALTAVLMAAPVAFACPKHDKQAQAQTSDAKTTLAVAPQADSWVCAMGPECSGHLAKGGECPQCGMKLIPYSEYQAKHAKKK